MRKLFCTLLFAALLVCSSLLFVYNVNASTLSFGGSTFSEVISQFDLVELAKLVFIALGIMWVIVLLVSVDRKFGRKTKEKQ
jgi:hypothetical protein